MFGLYGHNLNKSNFNLLKGRNRYAKIREEYVGAANEPNKPIKDFTTQELAEMQKRGRAKALKANRTQDIFLFIIFAVCFAIIGLGLFFILS